MELTKHGFLNKKLLTRVFFLVYYLYIHGTICAKNQTRKTCIPYSQHLPHPSDSYPSIQRIYWSYQRNYSLWHWYVGHLASGICYQLSFGWKMQPLCTYIISSHYHFYCSQYWNSSFIQ